MGGWSGVRFACDGNSYDVCLDLTKRWEVSVQNLCMSDKFSASWYDDGMSSAKTEYVLDFKLIFNDLMVRGKYDNGVGNAIKEYFGDVNYIESITMSVWNVDFEEVRWPWFGGRGGSSIQEWEVVFDECDQNVSWYEIKYVDNDWVEHNEYYQDYVLEHLGISDMFLDSIHTCAMVAGNEFPHFWNAVFNRDDYSESDIADMFLNMESYEWELDQIREEMEENEITDLSTENVVEYFKSWISKNLKSEIMDEINETTSTQDREQFEYIK